ncbi:phage tail assembly protein [Clostridium porci]|uniref:Phage tail assembly protein n=1 Tax=Clostridium porci TaxID=2605778 RepID=A0A7X2NKZ5_9CLOT|nr:phage tail assembly protein [Clostridium porci]MSS36606.1 phage tail assembly protein [Clostridium porci]
MDKKEPNMTNESKKDWLILNLKTPVEYQGMKITQLDMTGLRNMTGRDLNMVYDLYMAQGGGGVAMQESTLLFAQVVASRVCGYPIEAIMELKAKDSVYLKNRVYRFFFLSE